jgi:hypothetical protein
MATTDADLYFEWGQDLQLTAAGDLLLASGWDQVRQRIERRVFTNPATLQDNGAPIRADYYFHPTYGLGARAHGGDILNNAFIQKMTQLLNQGILVDQGVDTAILPTITSQQLSVNSVLFTILVYLANGTQETIEIILP